MIERDKWLESARFRGFFPVRPASFPKDWRKALLVAKPIQSYPAIILDYNRPGDVRFDVYNVAGIRIDKKWNFKKVALDVFLEIQNAFASQVPEPPQFGLGRDEMGNVLSPREMVQLPARSGTVIPTIGFVVDFQGFNLATFFQKKTFFEVSQNMVHAFDLICRRLKPKSVSAISPA